MGVGLGTAAKARRRRNTHRTPKGTAPPPDPTVIQAFGAPRYQRADEDQLRKALDDRRRAWS